MALDVGAEITQTQGSKDEVGFSVLGSGRQACMVTS